MPVCGKPIEPRVDVLGLVEVGAFPVEVAGNVLIPMPADGDCGIECRLRALVVRCGAASVGSEMPGVVTSLADAMVPPGAGVTEFDSPALRRVDAVMGVPLPADDETLPPTINPEGLLVLFVDRGKLVGIPEEVVVVAARLPPLDDTVLVGNVPEPATVEVPELPLPPEGDTDAEVFAPVLDEELVALLLDDDGLSAALVPSA